MDAERPNVKRSRKLWTIAVGIFALALLVVWVLFGFRVNLPGELASARARWEAQGLDSYRYRLNLGIPMAIYSAFIVTVTDGQVTQVEQYDNPLVAYSEPDTAPRQPISLAPEWYTQNYTEYLPQDFSHYTIDELFSFAQEKLANEPLVELCDISWRYEADYDTTFGYIDSFRYTNCGTWDVGLGLSCPVISECSMGLNISGVEVIEHE